MKNKTVTVCYMEERALFGLGAASNDKTVSADISALSQKYYAVVSRPRGSVLPYVVLSKDYDKQSRDFSLFPGSTFEENGLESMCIPAGEYAVMTVRPRLGFLWGAAIGEAKRYFYQNWLPESAYQARNLEYEYHTKQSKAARPSIGLRFAVQKNPAAEQTRG